MEESKGKVFKAILDVMEDLGAIGKDQKNEAQGFKFRGIDQVYNALHPLFAKHKVFCAPEVLERSERQYAAGTGKIWNAITLKVQYTFYGEDGSSFKVVTCGEGMDNGDKGTNKAMAQAHKYALFQVFIIATEDMVDPDGIQPEESVAAGTKTAAAPKSAPKMTPPAGAPPAASAPPKALTEVEKVNALKLKMDHAKTLEQLNEVIKFVTEKERTQDVMEYYLVRSADIKKNPK